ncbi:hypothetical protein AB0M46_01230 [Dactylosporangium sp. NPDC051485]|uniref:hypothetical protein n=1 Tax=Dactylosporangium sp. NPDC051485 TaxID=3154846 RepID=UPI00342A595C
MTYTVRSIRSAFGEGIKMAGERQPEGLLHRLTHRIPGVPGHADHPPGHQGRALRKPRPEGAPKNRNHTAARPPRVLVAWQRRVAALFGRQLP